MDVQTIFFIAIAIAQVVILFIYFYNRRQKKKKESEKKDALLREYPFEGLRNIALNTTPGALLASVPPDETWTFAVVMDWNIGSDIITLVTQVMGEANMYVRSGGGILGGGKYENVVIAAQNFIAYAQQLLPHMYATTMTPLPEKNYVQFFLLTNKGKFFVKEEMKNIEEKTSPWTGLFEEASKVIGEMKNSALKG